MSKRKALALISAGVLGVSLLGAGVSSAQADDYIGMECIKGGFCDEKPYNPGVISDNCAGYMEGGAVTGAIGGGYGGGPAGAIGGAFVGAIGGLGSCVVRGG